MKPLAPELDPEYSKMLSTPVSLSGGPHKDTIDSLQKQIYFYAGETHRLKYAQNSHVPVSRLQAELLSDVFLYLVESGLQGRNTYFVPGTFSFLQVCRRWNEVGVGFPRLWSLWVAGAIEAWPLFKSRSKVAPLYLTWRPRLPDSARDTLIDPTIPRRVQQLDFSGTSDQLAHFLGVFDSSPPSNVSSIRLQIDRYDDREPRERFSHLLSSPFPKLSEINIGNFLPSPSSPIFTTSKLTSLKLFLPYGKEGRHTLVHFSQILQQNPNLRELDLNSGAIPLPGISETPAPFVLPQLVELRLHGTMGDISGFMDLIGMSSPLHNVLIHFDRVPQVTGPIFASTMKKIVASYYNCQGLDYSRKIDSLTISSPTSGLHLIVDARSRSTPMSNFKLLFACVYGPGCEGLVQETLGLLPSETIREFTVEELALTRGMLEKMKDISHLHICNQNTEFVGLSVKALSLGNQDVHPVLKLESLTLANLNSYGLERKLLGVLKERHDHNLGLKKLVAQSCWTRGVKGGSKLKELVDEVEWDVMVTNEYSNGSDSDDSDSDDSDPDDSDPDDSDESTDWEEMNDLGLESDVDVCERLQMYVS